MDKVLPLVSWFESNSEYIPTSGIFDCRNTVGDPMSTVYDENDVRVEMCFEYDYIEVFGLSDTEFTLFTSQMQPLVQKKCDDKYAFYNEMMYGVNENA